MLLTIKNIKLLGERLKKIKNVEIPKVIEEIKKARKNGDLSENADYQYEKKKKYQLEEEIKNIENKISNAKIINNNNYFSLIILKDIKNNKLLKYNIDENSTEEDYKNILKLVNNKKIGDMVEIVKYNKKKIFKIINLKK